jgi:hypothetical protein
MVTAQLGQRLRDTKAVYTECVEYFGVKPDVTAEADSALREASAAASKPTVKSDFMPAPIKAAANSGVVLPADFFGLISSFTSAYKDACAENAQRKASATAVFEKSASLRKAQQLQAQRLQVSNLWISNFHFEAVST